MNRNSLQIASCLTVVGALALPMAAQAHGRVAWTGTVDDTALVTVHGQNVQTRSLTHQAVKNIDVQADGRLPHRPVFVSLRSRGRGQVFVAQQPRFSNDFTATVRIHDPQPGSSRYHFVLVW